MYDDFSSLSKKLQLSGVGFQEIKIKQTISPEHGDVAVHEDTPQVGNYPDTRTVSLPRETPPQEKARLISGNKPPRETPAPDDPLSMAQPVNPAHQETNKPWSNGIIDSVAEISLAQKNTDIVSLDKLFASIGKR